MNKTDGLKHKFCQTSSYPCNTAPLLGLISFTKVTPVPDVVSWKSLLIMVKPLKNNNVIKIASWDGDRGDISSVRPLLQRRPNPWNAIFVTFRRWHLDLYELIWYHIFVCYFRKDAPHGLSRNPIILIRLLKPWRPGKKTRSRLIVGGRGRRGNRGFSFPHVFLVGSTASPPPPSFVE